MADPDRLIWDRMLSHLRDKHAVLCRQWFSDLRPLGVASGQFNVRVPDAVKRNYLHKQCIDLFNDAAFTVTGRLMPVRFLGPDEHYAPNPTLNPTLTSPLPEWNTKPSARNSAKETSGTTTNEGVNHGSNALLRPSPAHVNGSVELSDSLPSIEVKPKHETTLAAGPPSTSSTGSAHFFKALEHRVVQPGREDSLVINPDYSFENFVVGPGNRLAHAAAVSVGASPGKAYNPLFVHGHVGLGKTHLLQAICLRIIEANPAAVLYYISCETFVTQFMEAVQAGQMNDFRHRFRDVDVLVIDDIHFLTRRERTQEEFFHTFNSLHHDQRQIVLSSDAPPEEIPDLEDRLVSRFVSGLVAKVAPPCYETRAAIIKTKSRLRGLDMPDDVACYIAGKIDTNIRELEGAITKIQILAQVDAKPIDLELAKTALGEDDSAPTSGPSIQTIIDCVTQYYRIKVTELQSKRRPRSVVLPRQVCMYLARRHTRHSLEEIGGYFGGRDHTTVMHAIKTIEVKLAEDEAFPVVMKLFEDRFKPAQRTAP